MKVGRPSHPLKPDALAKAPGVTETKGKGFAAALDPAEHVARTAGGTNGPAAARRAGSVSDIGADLKAGKITPQAAIDKVIERVLDKQLGQRATVALREKVGAALRESLADDPLLAAKVRALSSE
jgi:hypothetical protein